uniref:F-box protein AT5G49610-like beta-propeller domain-containing protein n=1 Tax=Aegilops tauschii subsp. strangulata TaxID=200361 RepID=A0A453N1R4_AEGTS
PSFVSPHLTGSNPSYLGFPPKLTPPTYIYLPWQLSRGGDLMMDAAAEVPQTICPEKRPHADVDGEAGQHSLAAVDPVSKVLGDNNLLAEILLRAGFPTTLVRAALVCRCWYHLASNRGFLRRFRELHPPLLLGFYIGSILIRPELVAFLCFVPMLPQPPELNTVVRRMANHNFDDPKNLWIMDSRNGSIFTQRREGRELAYGVHRRELAYGLHRPLCPERGINVVPALPRAQDYNRQYFDAILSKEEGNGLSYFYVLTELTNQTENFTLRVYMLQGSVWCLHTSATAQLHLPLPKAKVVLVDNKIYMVVSPADDIIVLDLTTSSLSRIQHPPGVKYDIFHTFLSRADDPSGVYVIHVNGFKLCIWLHKGDNWLLVDTICLHEMCANLRMLDNTLEDAHSGYCYVCHAGDNAEFVVLQMCGCIFYLDVKNRTLRKLVAKDQYFTDVYPFMMVWPPTFPKLKDGPARIAM